jgi:hypothetical protein
VSAAVQPSLVDRLTAADRRREVVRVQERLEPIVLGMADRYGAEGITASDVIAEAILGGILTGQEWRQHPRAYSWVGPWLAGLARAGKLKALAYSNDVPVRRRSERSPSHRNLQQVYIAPRFAA